MFVFSDHQIVKCTKLCGNGGMVNVLDAPPLQTFLITKRPVSVHKFRRNILLFWYFKNIKNVQLLMLTHYNLIGSSCFCVVEFL